MSKSKEETGTKALPITYEEVKAYSDNILALLDDLKEVSNDLQRVQIFKS